MIPFASDLEWSTLGAVPEMLQTAYGSLTVGLDAQPGQSILIRGGTSSVGMAAAVLAKQRNMTVLSTTRSANKTAALTDIGVDHVLIDDGNVARQVREILPAGVDTALELVGTPTLPDTLHSTRQHGVVCFTGMLSNVWTVRDFYPIDYLPRGVRLTAYHGEAEDLPQPVLQEFLDAVAAGHAVVPIDRVYGFDQIVEAHAAMEAGAAAGSWSSRPEVPGWDRNGTGAWIGCGLLKTLAPRILAGGGDGRGEPKGRGKKKIKGRLHAPVLHPGCRSSTRPERRHRGRRRRSPRQMNSVWVPKS